jgi:predicted RNA binding protein YcfA (HicA-like mRNA interferase family)
MPKIPMILAKDFLKYLIRFGAIEIGVKGSHHKVIYKEKTSTVALHNKIFDRGSFSGVLKQLNIDINEFIDFIEKN